MLRTSAAHYGAVFEHGIAPAPEERMRIFERVRLLIEGFHRDPKGRN